MVKSDIKKVVYQMPVSREQRPTGEDLEELARRSKDQRKGNIPDHAEAHEEEEKEESEENDSDVEYEKTGIHEKMHKPYDPNTIRVDPKYFTVREVISMIDDGTIELFPEFQRMKVWKTPQKINLIESLLLRIPLPAFYLNQDLDLKYQVIDGVQRLTTIYDFISEKGEKSFTLRSKHMDYLRQLDKKSFASLEHTWTRRILTTQLYFNVVDPSSPTEVKYDIFSRINTKGTKLNPQEIRHSLSKRRCREFLKELADLEIFQIATNNSIKEHSRMVDRELVLRFCAFRLEDVLENNWNYSSIDSFLLKTVEKIDNEKECTPAILQQLREEFRKALWLAHFLFGERAFRKWPADSERLSPINKPLFECLMVALVDYSWEELQSHKEKIVMRFRNMMMKSEPFYNVISIATQFKTNVDSRFRLAKTAIAEAIQC